MDSNVAAASGHDGDRYAERPQPSARDDRTTARQSATQRPANETRRTSQDGATSEPSSTDGNKPAAATSDAGARTERSADTGQTDAASQNADAADETIQDGSATTDAATAAQIALAAEVVPAANGGDAIAVANPPAPVVPTPAETAAAALSRVAADTGTGQANTAVGATAAVSTAPAAALLPASADGNVEGGKPNANAPTDVQTDAKAEIDLAAAAGKPEKSDDASHGKQTVRTGIDGLARDGTQELSGARASDAPEPNPAEAKGAPQPHATADRLETDAPKPAKPPQDLLAPAPTTHAQPATDPLQPNGFGLSHVSAPHAAANVHAAQLTAVAANNIPVPLNGLAVEIVANAQIGRSRFEIRLDPPELGRIDVKLDVDQQGQVTSHLIVEKSSTLEMLRRDAPQLERALQDAGLKTSDSGLQFSLRDQSQSGRNDNNDTGRNAHRLHITEEETITVEPAARGYGRMIGQRGGIDIRV